MNRTVSKSRFKPHALEFFRQIQETGEELIITDHGKPVLKITPYKGDPDAILMELRGSVLQYEQPTEPTGEPWEALT